MKFGDIIENTCAGDSNPYKFTVYLRRSRNRHLLLTKDATVVQYEASDCEFLRNTGDSVAIAGAMCADALKKKLEVTT